MSRNWVKRFRSSCWIFTLTRKTPAKPWNILNNRIYRILLTYVMWQQQVANKSLSNRARTLTMRDISKVFRQAVCVFYNRKRIEFLTLHSGNRSCHMAPSFMKFIWSIFAFTIETLPSWWKITENRLPVLEHKGVKVKPWTSNRTIMPRVQHCGPWLPVTLSLFHTL